MKKIKKLVAIALIGAMALVMAVPGFAATSSSDTGSITVSGLEGSVTVSAYQIATATYDANGNFTGYAMVSGTEGCAFQIASDGSYEEDALTEANLAELFGVVGITATKSVTTDYNGDEATLTDLPVGAYLIVVSGSEANTYAMMIGSVYYTTEDGEWTINNGAINATSDENLWAKKTTPTIDKEEATADGDAHGDSVSVGDEVTYHIHVGPIPAYYGDYPVFDVVDTVNTGLTITADEITDITVAVVDSADATTGGTTLEKGTDYIETDTSDGEGYSGFDINFVVSGSYTLNEYAGQYLLITYKATVTDDAVYAGNDDDEATHPNEVTLKFTPTSYVYMDDGDIPTTGDETYEYTFKVTTKKVGSDDEHSTALEGATFALYTDAECTEAYTQGDKAVTATSGDDGTLSFSGLAAGTYYMKETSAPAGYVLSDTVYTITIDATIDSTTGSLDSYEITIKNGDETITAVVNTQVNGQLPSTGGRGTLIFTLIGCAIVVCAVAGVVATRKRRAA